MVLFPITHTHETIRVSTASPHISHSVYKNQQGRNLSSAGQNVICPQKLNIKIGRDVKSFIYKIWVDVKYTAVFTQGKQKNIVTQ